MIIFQTKSCNATLPAPFLCTTQLYIFGNSIWYAYKKRFRNLSSSMRQLKNTNIQSTGVK